VKAFLKERATNAFEFIDNKPVEAKLFKSLVAHPPSLTVPEQPTSGFSFFDSQVSPKAVSAHKNDYIDMIKDINQVRVDRQTYARGSSSREIIRADCVLLKAFYQTKGTLILTHDELIFVYMDLPQSESLDIRNHD